MPDGSTISAGLGAGIYDGLPAAVYHADPCIEPSLSSGLLRTLLERGPMHARYGHPRMNSAAAPRGVTEFQDAGSAIHRLLLRTGSPILAIDRPDFRTKAAKAARNRARAAGRIPILLHDMPRLAACAVAAREQIAAIPDVSAHFAPGGVAERTLIWKDEEFGIWCRALIDWTPAQPRAPLYDIKTTATDASPEGWSRRLINAGYALQAAFYLRGARALGMEPTEFRFLPIECDPPHGLSVVGLAPDLLGLAEQRMRRGMRAWAEAIRTDDWPSYPRRVCYATAPIWLMEAWGYEQARDAAAHDPVNAWKEFDDDAI